MTDFAMLAMPQLVHEYNTLAFELGLSEVKRFRSREDGVRRCLEIQERHHQAKGNGHAEENDVTSIAETIRAAQAEDVDIPENPEEAKAALAEEFEGSQEPADAEKYAEETATEQDAESATEVHDNPYYTDDSQEYQVQESNEAHAEFGSDDLPPPEQAPKKGRKPRQVKTAPVGPTKDVDISSPDAIFQAFQVRDGTNKARLIKALINKLDEAEAVDVLVRETYGEEAGKDKVGAMLGGVCLGIQVAIDANNLPFTLKKGKHEEDLFLGLYHTPRQG